MFAVRAAAVLLATLLTACAAPPLPVDALAGAPGSRDQLVTIPVTDPAGVTTEIRTRVCRPDTAAPAPLVVINHGSPPNAAARPRMQLTRCDSEAAQWFLRRGFAVAFPLRRGYGLTGGPYAETSGPCREADYVRAGLETARDVQAVVDHLTRVPFIRPNGAVVLGQSAGGWGTVALDSIPHPKVAALVSMAGGRGGHYEMRPGHNCRPEKLIEAAGHFGATASTPMLWIYTANDSFFAPPIAAGLYRAFTDAGGRADFVQLPAYGADGHGLFFGHGGPAIWGPLVERYLERQGVLPG